MPEFVAVHLYRGAPPVRSWSRYRQTDREWTLCGRAADEETHATVDAGQVTCEYCLLLMRPASPRRMPACPAAAATTPSRRAGR
jgi:hypothetical protein